MLIAMNLAFHEGAATRLLNWLALENARILRDRPELPLLYESGVVYGREKGEAWCDIPNMLARGWEDCDGLAAARAGELMAKGVKALSPTDPGYEQARTLGLKTIPAEVFLKTQGRPGKATLYHCVVRYQVGGIWHHDDPSARLGMNGAMDPSIPTRLSKGLAKARRLR